MRKHKIPLEKVQEAFNAAIKRRDRRCMIRDYEPCEGELECSHFKSVGSSPSLRFYPPNAYSQCQKHHWTHHHKLNRNTYAEWMWENHLEDVEILGELSNRYIKYTDELKAEIIKLCNEDRLEDLKILIEKVLEK